MDFLGLYNKIIDSNSIKDFISQITLIQKKTALVYHTNENLALSIRNQPTIDQLANYNFLFDDNNLLQES